jgi:hypothetical protein
VTAIAASSAGFWGMLFGINGVVKKFFKEDFDWLPMWFLRVCGPVYHWHGWRKVVVFSFFSGQIAYD